MNSSCNFWARFGRLLHCIVTSFIRERGKKNNLITGCYGEETEVFLGRGGEGRTNMVPSLFACLLCPRLAYTQVQWYCMCCYQGNTLECCSYQLLPMTHYTANTSHKDALKKKQSHILSNSLIG